MGNEPRKAGGPKNLEKRRKQILLEPLEEHAALLTFGF